MNTNWLIALAVWSMTMFAAGFKVESWRAGEKLAQLEGLQQKVTISAQQGVIAKQQKAEAITNAIGTQYEKELSDINSKYDADGVQRPDSPTGGRLPAFSRASTTVCSCPQSSKAHRLTPKQCDIEEQKLIGLWGWVSQQRQ